MTLKADGTKPLLLRDFLRQSGVSAQLLTRLKQFPDGMTREGVQIRANETVYPGDVIRLKLEKACAETPNPALSVPVLYASPQLVIADKPAGMPSHPSMLHRTDTLANWYAAVYAGEGFHLVTRLDRDTTGVCIIARTPYAVYNLRGRVKKTYYALVRSGLTAPGTVDAPIARVRESVITRCVRPDGRRAVTHYEPVIITPERTLLRVTPETGRTHQIRVHLAHIGYPIAGDDLYGGDCSILKTQALHCGAVCFPEPLTGREMTVTAPLPEAVRKLLPEADFLPPPRNLREDANL